MDLSQSRAAWAYLRFQTGKDTESPDEKAALEFSGFQEGF